MFVRSKKQDSNNNLVASETIRNRWRMCKNNVIEGDRTTAKKPDCVQTNLDGRRNNQAKYGYNLDVLHWEFSVK